MTRPPFPAAAVAQARLAAAAHLRMAGDAEVDALAGYVASALALCEAFTGLSLIVRDHQQRLVRDGQWRRLVAAPVLRVGTVVATDRSGALSAEAVAHRVAIDGDGTGWVFISGGATGGGAQVGYSAGLAAQWSDLPPTIAQGVVLLIAHLFNDRGAEAAPPAAVAALWRPHRRLTIGGCAERRP